MKEIIYIVTLVILSSCGQSSSEQTNEQKITADTVTVKTDLKNEKTESNAPQNFTEQTDYHSQSLNYKFKKTAIYQLTDRITADFNGDGKGDQAIFKKENETSGIIIKHGLTNKEIRIGFGEPFAHLTEFNCVDYWGLVNDSETYEIVIENAEIIGDRKVKLENPSIVVGKEEAGGGLISFRNEKYEWIHQAD